MVKEVNNRLQLEASSTLMRARCVCGPELALKLENSAETSFIAQSSAVTRHQRQVPGEESESERGVITDTFKCGQ